MKCKGCRTEIRWIKTTSLSRMPVDLEEITVAVTAEPPVGAIAQRRVTLITRDGKTETGYSCSAIEPGARSITGHVPHWATCPEVALFKKRRSPIEILQETVPDAELPGAR